MAPHSTVGQCETSTSIEIEKISWKLTFQNTKFHIWIFSLIFLFVVQSGVRWSAGPTVSSYIIQWKINQNTNYYLLSLLLAITTEIPNKLSFCGKLKTTGFKRFTVHKRALTLDILAGEWRCLAVARRGNTTNKVDQKPKWLKSAFNGFCIRFQ